MKDYFKNTSHIDILLLIYFYIPTTGGYMTDIKTQLVKINALLENLGQQLLRIEKDPSVEKKIEDVINNNLSDAIFLAMEALNSKEVKNKKVLALLKDISIKDIKQNWVDFSAALKKYVNVPQHLWED